MRKPLFVRIALVAVVLLVISLGTVAAQTPAPIPADSPTATLQNYVLALGGLMLLLVPLVKAVGKITTWPEDRVALVLGGLISPLAHATIPTLAAPAIGPLGFVWSVIGGLIAGAGAGLVADRIINPLLPNRVDASFSRSGE